tara:strand:- start:200 stop:418 length:219 start_codon:yes stop_codon:yes gene_type:complete
MCIGPLAPKPPELPEPVEAAPRPEKTAKAPVIGRRRSVIDKSKSSRSIKRSGIRSLRIPSISNKSGSGNLNY